jgi:hypothetical protein
MKLSYKDLLLLFGILVAVIITLTTLVYHEEPLAPKTSETEVAPKTGFVNPGGLIKKAIGVVKIPPLKP